jgi:alpha-L-fucosidase 2
MRALGRANFVFWVFMAWHVATGAELHRDVPYTSPGGVALALDATIPDGDGPFPAAIIVHGGGWVRGDKRIDVEPLFRPLTDAGFAWFSINYRLATNALQFGAAIGDVEDAIRFVKAHAAEYHVDPERIALVGESAGGQLAAMAALNGDPALSVKAVVAFYTPSDLVSLVRDSDLIPQSIRDSVQGTAFQSVILARLSQLSPIDNVRAGMPPFLLIHGTADRLVPVEQSDAMCARIRGVGASCDLFKVEGAGHGVRWWESSPRLSGPYKREMIRWLKEHLTTGIV